MTEELPGFVRREFLPSPDGRAIATLAWSCDGRRLATGGLGGDIWEAGEGGGFRRTLMFGGPHEDLFQVVWSPTDPDVFAYVQEDWVTLARVGADGRSAEKVWSRSFTSDRSLRGVVAFAPAGDRIAVAGPVYIDVVAVADQELLASYRVGFDDLAMLSWSPTENRLLLVGDDLVALMEPDRSDRLVPKPYHRIRWTAWAPDGRTFALVDDQSLVRVYSTDGAQRVFLEGHTGGLLSVEFSADGRLLYSVGLDHMLRLWRTDTWERVGRVDLGVTHEFVGGLAAAPHRPLLARRSIDPSGVELYEADYARLVGESPEVPRTYANAKVVLLGDTGVGKSGLGLVLTGRPYEPTDSTHARKVRSLDVCEVERPDGGVERREILLWDMAGQPAYRLVHQLHLAEVAAALIVFDARSEIDPFAGVRYWVRAMRQRTARTETPLILVAARTDIGGRPVSRVRVDALRDQLGLAGYFETSAKDDKQIAELGAAIREVIDWSSLPRSVSSDLFDQIKQFLLDEAASRRLATTGELFRAFRPRAAEVSEEELRASFDTCVRLLELRDLVRRLSFGDFVLLRPELLDSYAAALVIAARDQPDGLGYIAEDDALAGRFPIPSADRLPAAEERLLLIAVVEELLRHDLVLREPTADGIDLVFPSQLTADRPDAPSPDAEDVVFQFDGAVQTVYATLAVRLAHVPEYRRDGMWRDASAYRARVGGVCGLRVRQTQEGHGELAVFFTGPASEETRFLFEEYVRNHLEARAVPGSVQRDRIYTCPGCAYRVPVDLVRRRQGRGDRSMACPDCEDVRISLLDREDRLSADRGVVARPSVDAGKTKSSAAVRDMNASADEERDQAAATASVFGKEYTRHYDVFLSYHPRDRDAIDKIADELRRTGLLPVLAPPDHRSEADRRAWAHQQIGWSRSGAVFLGPHGLSEEQETDLTLLVAAQTQRPKFRIVPALLPGAGRLTWPLARWTGADLTTGDQGIDELRWLITGERPRDEFPR
ncbi:hypothetical protein Ade02nite_21510 [Paractinoplanes deccanensis]|uniref:TIR domain-containing protein n=1 Tax=Paractinoplanes deccanensis TaxID=113561 RepID=A0ABQ3Y0K1_9ACTN|nr:TIR domain-containing protein [Actinoplanes deccanensis]GID73510.1 hypothetical protein Ade02nite_21510 [Actinoplanes deccanensis]